MLKRFILVATCCAITCCLTGCERTLTGFCPAAVRADQQTKAWFMSIDTPPYVLDYLNRIGHQQQAIEENCK